MGNVVLGCLRQADQPLSAYQLLDRSRDEGITAPTTLYRALDRLVGLGLVHKLATLNAFTAYTHGHPSGEAVCFVCDRCGRTVELAIRRPLEALRTEAAAQGFTVSEKTVELVGRCAARRERTQASPPN